MGVRVHKFFSDFSLASLNFPGASEVLKCQLEHILQSVEMCERLIGLWSLAIIGRLLILSLKV